MRQRFSRALTAAVAVTVFAVLLPASASGEEPTYSAEIRRTEHGIPHILADDWGSLSFGQAYAFAEDNICVMADTFVTVNAERSVHFGPDGTYRSEANGVVPRNIDSDFYYQWINESGVIESLIDGTYPDSKPLSEPLREGVRGWVAGYNAYLRDVGGADGVSDPACQGEDWVAPIGEMDLYRRFYQLIMFASKGALLPYIVAAKPPTPTLVQLPSDDDAPDASMVDVDAIPSADKLGIGSNAYALGSEATENGKGMLLGNPHFPWRGPERFYQFHLTMPGKVNVSGGALFGSPLVHIGVNEHIAWSHTVSVPYRFTPYELTLAPGDPTSYIYDGQVRRMKQTTVSVQARTPDGSLEDREHTFYETHFGPVMDFTGALMPWTPVKAFALRDANQDNFRALEHFLEINQASSVQEVEEILSRHLGIPWVNTIATDDQGGAFYADMSVVPHITDDKLERCATPVGRALMQLARLPVLDGSRSDCEWGSDPDAPVPGIFGGSSLPKLHRSDYVANSNDSYWLSNPKQPLEGYPYVMGPERTPRSLRTRLGIRMLQETVDEAGDTFSLDQLQDTVFNNRHYAAELVRDDLVAVCRAAPVVLMQDGTTEDVSEACDVLAAWDRTVNTDAKGAHLFREFMRFAFASTAGFFLDPFNPDDPVNTPRQLNVANPDIRAALATAVRRLRTNGIALDAELGTQQQAVRNDLRIPIHGGSEHGIFNYINSPWAPKDGVGYPDTIYGASFVLAAEFTDDGPRARTILTYSLSTDPTSPYFADQTELYSRKEWVPVRLSEAEVLSSPALTTYTVEG
jgi:acyl-homoserine-lactone acylase